MLTTPPTVPPQNRGVQPRARRPEFVQAFIDLWHAPGVLWGVNLAYFLESVAYFGILSGPLWLLLGGSVGLSAPQAELTIEGLISAATISMIILGGLADRLGVRRSMLLVFVLLLGGRGLLALGPSAGLNPGGLWSPIHLLTTVALLMMVVAYGVFQPAVAAAVRQFTSRATAGMAFALLYAVMNLGGLLPGLLFFAPTLRLRPVAMVWFYVILTATALICTYQILTRRKVRQAIADSETARDEVEQPALDAEGHIVSDLECLNCGYNLRTLALNGNCPECGIAVRSSLAQGRETPRPDKEPFSLGRMIAKHPLANGRFMVLLLIVMPVQTLFAHNWLTLPAYVDRALRGSMISDLFDTIVMGLNPVLIVLLVPLFAALTHKRSVFNLLIVGTLAMAGAPVILILGPSPWTLVGYLLCLTIGEAIWQPRFLQYVAEIAPRGRTGVYMGVAQTPWLLTKLIVPVYAGWCLQQYCPDPDVGTLSTRLLWLIYAAIAMMTPVLLILMKGWIGKDFKTKSDS